VNVQDQQTEQVEVAVEVGEEEVGQLPETVHRNLELALA